MGETMIKFKKIGKFLLVLAFFIVPFFIPGYLKDVHASSVYYVSLNGNDSNPGTMAMPFKTIYKATSILNSGDTLIIRGGTYNESIYISDKNGNDTSWINIKSYPGEKVILDGQNSFDPGTTQAFTLYKSSYIHFDGIEIKNYTSAGIYITSGDSHINITNMIIHDLDGQENTGAGVEGILGEGASYCTVRGNEIYNVGLKLNKPKDHGIYIGYGVSNWTIDSNRIHDNSGAGVQMYGDPNGGSYSTVSNNLLYNNHAYGLVVSSNATGNNIEGNIMYNNGTSDVYMMESASGNSFTDNIFGSSYSIYNIIMADTGSFSNSFNNNSYYKSNGYVVCRYDTAIKFNTWKSYSQESDGKYLSSPYADGDKYWVPVSGKAYTSSRLSGPDRFGTATAIANQVNTGICDNVVIASGYNYPDALSGSVLAKKLDAPILLSGNSASESEYAISYVKEHLKASGAIYILGGPGVVNTDLEDIFKSLGFNNIIRLGGIDRYDTNSIINYHIHAATGTPVVIASGNDFPDALSISSIAAYNGYPIILTDKYTMSQQAEQTINSVHPSAVYIVGGEGVIQNSVTDRVKSLTNLPDSKIVRIWGNDRYDTSLKIASYFNLNSNTITFANGENFPDALAGSVLAAKLKAPILLINDEFTSQKKYVDSTQYLNEIIFGGTGVVDSKIEEALKK